MDKISKIGKKLESSNRRIASPNKMIDVSMKALIKIIKSSTKASNKKIYSPLKPNKSRVPSKLSARDPSRNVKSISPTAKLMTITKTSIVIKSQSRLNPKTVKNRIGTPNSRKTSKIQAKAINATIPTVLSSNNVNIPAIQCSNDLADNQTVLSSSSLSNSLKSNSNLNAPNTRISSISLKTTLESPSISTEEQFLIKKNWQPVEKIAYGGFSVVYKVFSTAQSSKTNLKNNSLTDVPYFAAKVIRLNETNRIWVNKCLRHEMYISKLLKHENIVKTYQHFKSKTFAVIIMQLYVNGTIREDLDKRMKPYNSNEAIELFYGLINGLSYMHQMNIAHRDLKLDNFFLNKTRKPFIGDFGFATLALRQSTLIIDSIMRATRCGSEWYMAPEVAAITQNNDDQVESPKATNTDDILFTPTKIPSASKIKLKYRYNAKQADIYSMGVCFYEMLQRSFPFLTGKQKNKTRMTKNASKSKIIALENANKYVKEDNLEIVFKGNIEKQLQEIIISMLQFNPEQRPNVDQIFKRISSIYYQKCLFSNNFAIQNPKCVIN